MRRDVHRAEQQSPLRPILPLESLKQLPAFLDETVGRASPRTLGMELDVLPANTFFFFDEKIFPKDRIVDVSGLIRQVRMVKSSWELEMMRGAAAISPCRRPGRSPDPPGRPSGMGPFGGIGKNSPTGRPPGVRPSARLQFGNLLRACPFRA